MANFRLNAAPMPGINPPKHSMYTPSYWRGKSLLLMIELRKCKSCGRVHRCPGTLHVRLEIAGKVWLNPAPETYTRSILGLHERREIEVEIDACENCFESVPEGQLCLFPELFQTSIVRATQRAASAWEAEERTRIVSDLAKAERNGTKLTPRSAPTPKPKLVTLDDFLK